MSNYIVISTISGVLFGVLDGVINANPLARKLYQVYTPITKKTLNLAAGIVIDLVYGFVMAGVFWLLYESLPGGSGIIKGLSFAALVWFFRVIMYNASQWMMYSVPLKTLLYSILTGLGEMAILCTLYGLFLEPTI
jgi:hypothetical protein